MPAPTSSGKIQQSSWKQPTIREVRQELSHKSAAEKDVRQELAYLRGRAEAMAAERQIALTQPKTKVDGSSKRPTAAKTKTPNGA